MSSMQELLKNSYLSAGSMTYIEDLYDDYLSNPTSVSDDWRQLFDQYANGDKNQLPHRDIIEYFKELAQQKPQAVTVSGCEKQAEVTDLINSFRAYGHLMAKLDPLGLDTPRVLESLKPETHGLSLGDTQAYFVSHSLSKDPISLNALYELLKRIYCGSIGLEFMHITDETEKNWWQERFETQHGRLKLTAEQQKTLLKELIAADGFERYLHTRFVGQKRFSLEGGDALIPMLKNILRRACQKQVSDVVIGMAHRGRLNVLINIVGKAPKILYDEFEGKYDENRTGDVKYHLGFSSDLIFDKDQSIHSVLAFNPSHLEIIGPVVEGSVRARLCRYENLDQKNEVVPVVIHGDSAFTGQGVVMETFNFSQARGYSTGGTVHIVINNQVGFTTNLACDTRSSNYCTDIAKMVQAPVLHVNGDDAEAVIFATELALDYRMTFKRDVVIDLVCYRRQGHNEADEAMLTQPLMYQIIRQHPVPREIYAKQLIDQGVIDHAWYKAEVDDYRNLMDKGEPLVETLPQPKNSERCMRWAPYLDTEWTASANTGVPSSTLKSYMQKMCKVPEGFTVHPVVQKTLNDRLAMVEGTLPMNWGCAEALGFASLLQDGYEVRLSGQDCGRGTFSHRHAVWHDQKTGSTYIPLEQFVTKANHPFTVIDSVLSEEAVLAFEYGYAASEPQALVIWEGQFGDFVNGAQVVIDQFISSGEQKWGRLCGLTMFLPHGYEGQGPEHSSARLERFMQLCAEHNMQVCVPTTPAQIFHLMRRQLIRPYRKPLVVMTPKSLLRHRLAVSTMDDLVHGSFQNIIPEVDNLLSESVDKIILCCGKVYYDLLQARMDKNIQNVAIVRIEQLYPFPEEELKKILATYPNAKNILWCQEEPKNQGAWFTSQHHMQACLKDFQNLSYVGRELAAAPAVGSPYLHAKQQQAFIDAAFNIIEK